MARGRRGPPAQFHGVRLLRCPADSHLYPHAGERRNVGDRLSARLLRPGNLVLGADVDGAAVEAYGVWVEKKLYGREYMGVERATFLIGPDGKIAKVWHKVKVPGHVDDVLKAARAL